ncbi:leucyl/phenylalanyl-tRNA--protein transferase [Yoonia vestfoldensis]|uniref:Leucyl/phenylalanyl-tRNA--protein transferase n=1 Tax=Yoonia vestfoldensis TaxID=245188 RepID=A0A1Y0ED87_9RHOB|nr:leucyl/phenylalanyl-tRNA--protein transferase [Yoonia vestfoldensis]ARU01341.1 leucyl/phenylalanyl-tRNA--protein transferase [Yoonia vestfoldensis]
MSQPPLTPALVLQAYRLGVFPMSESRDDPGIFWVDPRRRGVFPLDQFRISHSLARTIRRGQFRVSFDTAFADVVDGCADRPETWINPSIRDLSLMLHRQGHAHAVEVWQDAQLVGGVYGIHIGAAFFGESMFSRATDASKVALAYLLHNLRGSGFTLFDTQFLTPHLPSLGAVEIPRAQYHRMLAAAVAQSARFSTAVPASSDVIQRKTQTS